jgi:hypothetical protein
MAYPSKNTFKCPKWLQCICCLSPIAFLGCLSVGAACGVAVSPYVAIPLVILNAKVIAVAFGSDIGPLVTFGNTPANKLFRSANSNDHIERKGDAA